MEYTSGSVFINQYWVARLFTRAFIPCLLAAGLWLAAGSALAQFEAPVPSAPRAAASKLSARGPAPSNQASFARAAGIVGASCAGLLLAGGLGIAVADDAASESITRGLMLGVTGLSVPVVALLAFRTRKLTRVESLDATRSWGWYAWSGATLLSALQWVLALGGDTISPGLTLASAGMGALSVSIHTIDAFVSARRARLQLEYRIAPLALSATLRF